MLRSKILPCSIAFAAALALTGCLGGTKNKPADDAQADAGQAFAGVTPQQVRAAWEEISARAPTENPTEIRGSYSGAMQLAGENDDGVAVEVTAELDVAVEWEAAAGGTAHPFSGTAGNFTMFQGGQIIPVAGTLEIQNDANNRIDGNASGFSMFGTLTAEGDPEAFSADFEGTFYGADAGANAGTVSMVDSMGTEVADGIYVLESVDDK